MTYAKALQKKARCRQHRTQQYEKALDQLIAGEVSPRYVKERADKLKQVRG